VTKGGLFRRQGEEYISAGRLIVVSSPAEDALAAKKDTEAIHIYFERPFLDQLAIGLWDGTTLMRLFPDRGHSGPALIGSTPEDSYFADLSALFASVLREYREKKADYRQMIRLKVLEILLHLERIGKNRASAEREDLRSTADGASAPMEGPASVVQIRDDIQENYAENFSLQEMARRCGLNSSYFSRAFREAVGVPPFEFINRIRVQKACLLLKRTEMTILEIALSVGYNNISFFNRYFRKIMKMSPREYRNYATG
jgi:AraC-like DNA-binding protein